MDNALFMAVLSLAVTLLTSLFKTVRLTKKQKASIAGALSIVAGIASVAVSSGDFSPANLAANTITIFGASQAFYQFILNGTGLNKTITNKNLFGSHQAAVEEAATNIEVIAKEVAKPKAAPAKKTAAKKTTAKKTTE